MSIDFKNPDNKFKIFNCKNAVNDDKKTVSMCRIETDDIKKFQSGFLSGFYIPQFKQVNRDELDEGQILGDDKQIFNRSTTFFFRKDINWQDFGKFLKEYFKNLDDVDIFCFGCSTGKEPYSLAMVLKKYFEGEKFKIKASDIIPDVIEEDIKQQSVGVFVSGEDVIRLAKAFGCSLTEAQEYFQNNNLKFYQLKQDIVDCVEFEQKNILKSLDNIDKNKRTIIMARNMWPYIDSNKYNEFVKKLYDRLNDGSIIVVGEFDCFGDSNFKNSNGFPKALLKAGFTPTKRGTSRLYKGLGLVYLK